jgi:HEAT repeat protein
VTVTSRTERRHQRRALAARALELHREGKDILAIADAMGITVSRAASLLTFALEKMPGFHDDQLVALSDARLDKLAEVFRRSLDSDDEKVRMQAAESLRRLEADRARLIALGMKT